jgi:hypothetical protein
LDELGDCDGTGDELGDCDGTGDELGDCEAGTLDELGDCEAGTLDELGDCDGAGTLDELGDCDGAGTLDELGDGDREIEGFRDELGVGERVAPNVQPIDRTKFPAAVLKPSTAIKYLPEAAWKPVITAAYSLAVHVPQLSHMVIWLYRASV